MVFNKGKMSEKIESKVPEFQGSTLDNRENN